MSPQPVTAETSPAHVRAALLPGAAAAARVPDDASTETTPDVSESSPKLAQSVTAPPAPGPGQPAPPSPGPAASRWRRPPRIRTKEDVAPMVPLADLVLRFGERTLRLDRGSITDAKVAAIVTAANAALAGGGGVDYVVHDAAGPELLRACRRIGGCETGSAVATPAFDLERNGVRRVIHAVGPVWHGGRDNETDKLRDAYAKSLQVADAEGCESVALPAISCGVYRFPLAAAAQIALTTVAGFLQTTAGPVQEVVFVLFDPDVFNAFRAALLEMKPMSTK